MARRKERWCCLSGGSRGWLDEGWRGRQKGGKVGFTEPRELYKYVIDTSRGWREVDYPETSVQVQGTRAGLEPNPSPVKKIKRDLIASPFS